MAKQGAELPVIQACYDFTVWLLPKIGKLPRDLRYTLGEKIERLTLCILEGLNGRIVVSCAGARGTTTPGTPAPPTGTGTRPTTGTTTLGSVYRAQRFVPGGNTGDE